MRHALTMALRDYEGAMVLVSHDRERCAPPAIVSCWSMAAASSPSTATSTTTATGSPAAVECRGRCPPGAADKAARKADRAPGCRRPPGRLVARRPLVKELEQIDKRLAAWNKEKVELDAKLADPAL